MSLADAFIEPEARYRAAVMTATWGHLEPEPRRKYYGGIWFTHGAYGDLVVVKSELQDLPDSPGYFQDQADFIGQQTTDAGRLYYWHGYYRRFKNGRAEFRGTVQEIKL